MKNIGQRYRLGIWTVNAGNIPEFIEAWQSSSEWIAQNLHDDGEAVLLQDIDDPRKFVSFAFATNLDKAEEVMSRTEFQELWSDVMALCEEVKPHRMQVAGYSALHTEDQL
jgi:hypothetical protein